MKKSVVLRLRQSGIIHRHRLLLITMDGGDGPLSPTFHLTSGGHITMVIIGLITMGIVLMLIVMVGIISEKGPRGQGFKGSSERLKNYKDLKVW